MAGKKTFFKVDHDDVDTGYFAGWTKGELQVWLVLKRHEGKDHKAFPGFKRIQELTGLQPRHIDSAIRRLEDRGVLHASRWKRAVNHYLLLPKGK